MTTVRRVYFALIFFASVILFGSAGYMVLEGADPLTAVYMTVITVATVGFEEAVHLDSAGRVFTIVLILAGLASTTLLTVTVVAFLVEGEFRRLFRSRSMQKRIGKMKNHFIICGLGQAGRSVLDEFMAVKAPCVVVEKNPSVAEEVSQHYPNLAAIVGDATTDEMLVEAGVERARGLIAATESDSDNLLIVLTARSKNPGMTITSRATRTENFNKMRVAGANHVVMPNVIGGARMAATLIRPKVIDFLDVMIRGSGETFRMEEAEAPVGSPVIGKTLLEVEIPKKTGLLVLAIRRKSGQYVFSPTSAETFQEGDVLIVVGPSEKIPVLERVLAGKN